MQINEQKVKESKRKKIERQKERMKKRRKTHRERETLQEKYDIDRKPKANTLRTVRQASQVRHVGQTVPIWLTSHCGGPLVAKKSPTHSKTAGVRVMLQLMVHTKA